jgi:RNA polymerase subunit RPABC4/transcription elongation factor Spt4
MEGVLVEVVGMEEFNTTTDAEGNYSFVVPLLEVGHAIRFKASDHAPREVTTGPLEDGMMVTIDTTLSLKPPYATLHIIILPWEMPGSNYGLRQDVMTVVNATGTARFEWSEKSAEEDAVVPAPGTYMVTGSRPGYYPLTVVVTVDRGDRTDVDLDLTDRKKPTYGTVNGTVDFQGFPVENVTVVAEPVEGSRTYEARTGEDGNFNLQLPNGTYKVSVSASGFAKLSEGVVVELGKTAELYFPMTVAQDTGEEDDPILGLIGIIVAIAVLGAVMVIAINSRRKAEREAGAKEALGDELSCPECGASATSDADACAECGTRFPWKSFRCPECGAVMELDSQRCPECGNETFDLHRG